MLKSIFKLTKLLFSLPFLLLVLVSLLLINSNILKGEDIQKKEDTEKDQPVNNNEEKEVEPATLVYEEDPAYSGAHYFQKFEVIADQWAYIAYPLKIELKNPPVLVIYSHGSNTTITNSSVDPFMKDMIAYGKFFTDHGYAFAASNQHGANWGSDAAIADMTNVINWISERYNISEKVNLLAHSMGGLPTLYFAFKYPDQVNKIALLSPTTYIWGKDKYDALADIPVTIWHGDKDVNIGWSVSKGFVDRGASYGKEIKLVTVQGGTHWDVDTELKDDILTFYNE